MIARRASRGINSTGLLCVLVLISERWNIAEGHEGTLQRQKRFLLYYPNGGGFKCVLGLAIPVKLGLKQTMSMGWNVQFQYQGPRTTNDTRFYPPVIAGRGRRKREKFMSDRALAYMGIEAILNKNGINGRACLLRAICETALESPHQPANGLYGQLLHITLTPPDDDDQDGPDSDLEPDYLDARRAGEFGVDCTSLYPDCAAGSGLLDMISVLDY